MRRLGGIYGLSDDTVAEPKMDAFDDAPEGFSAHEYLMTVHSDSCISNGALNQ